MSGGSPFGPAPQSGTAVGPYTLHEHLGSGGIAAVYRATTEAGEARAVKVLHPQSLGTDEVRRFEREYKALSRLRHPNVVRVYETGVLGGYPWIAMDFVDGADLETVLADWAEREPEDRWQRVERILRGLLHALDHVHELGLVHRDLKPGNVMIDKDGVPRLGDFGVVKDRRSHTTALTMHGNLVGTVAYMAPEQIMDEAVDNRTDLYSLGAILYVLLTGQRPIQADSVTGFLARHLSHVPDAPSSLRPDVPRRLEAICQRLLYKERSQRFATAAAVLRALDDETGPDVVALRGRDALLTAWRSRLDRLADGDGGVVHLAGPPHSGRSFCLDALAGQAEDCGQRVVRTTGHGRNPITSLLRAVDPDADALPAEKHLRALATALRGQPTVVLIDEVDQLSDRMLDALGRLVRKLVAQEAEPLLLVVVSDGARPVQDALIDGLATDLPAEVLHLDPLERKDVLALLRDRGLRGPVAAVLARRLLATTRGRAAAVHHQLQALVQEGWLERRDSRLLPLRDNATFETARLPVPGRARTDVERQLTRLDPEALGAAEVLALLDRPVPLDLVLGCVQAPPSTAERLVLAGLWHVLDLDGGAVVRFDHPWASTVLMDQLDPDRAKALHAELAEALTRNGRFEAREIAHHHEQAGNAAEALVRYVDAARAAARQGLHARVLDLCTCAERVVRKGTLDLPHDESVRCLRRLRLVQGEARLAKGDWQDAVTALEGAVAAAREEGAPGVLARCLGSLGRAWYRLGQLGQAEPPLREALALAEPGAPESAAPQRVLADILMRRAQLPEAEALWRESLTAAKRAQSVDGEARARRGLAHLRVLQGRYDTAAAHLDEAETLLQGTGSPHVRAGVLARGVELDRAAGRWGSALRRALQLVELCIENELSDRLGEAHALLADAAVRAGDRSVALDAVAQARTWLRVEGADTARLRLQVARILCDLDKADEATALLPEARDLPGDPLEDPSAQLAALRARCLAPHDPRRALDLARWCLVRPPARLAMRWVDTCLDAGDALRLAKDPAAARGAAKAGLASLEGPGADGLRLELLDLFSRADPDPRIVQARDQVAQRVRALLPPDLQLRFDARFPPPSGTTDAT